MMRGLSKLLLCLGLGASAAASLSAQSNRTPDECFYPMVFRHVLAAHQQPAPNMATASPSMTFFTGRIGLNDNESTALIREAQAWQAEVAPLDKSAYALIAAIRARTPGGRLARHRNSQPCKHNPSARSYSVALQTFIPAQNAEAPYRPPPFCGPAAYLGLPLGYFQGDNRDSVPTVGSYRALEQVTLGLGGIKPPTIGVKDVGWTHLYAGDAIQNNLITQAAMADTIQGDCHYLIWMDRASSSQMTTPSAYYDSGTTSVYTVLTGQVGNPLTPSGTIEWNGTVRLTQTSPTSVQVTGSMYHECFPGYEVSVGGTDVGYYPPPKSDFYSIATCLGSVGAVTENINKTLTVAP